MKTSAELFAELEALRVACIHLGAEIRMRVMGESGGRIRRMARIALIDLAGVPVEKIEEKHSDSIAMSWFLEKIPVAGELVFTPALRDVEGNLSPVLVYYWR